MKRRRPFGEWEQPPVDIVKRLTSAAKHDGKVYPSGGTPPTALSQKLLLDAAREIRKLRRTQGR